MKINSGYRDLLQNLNFAGVRYLIVGAYAVMIHTEPRYTKDLDVWIEPAEALDIQTLLTPRMPKKPAK